MIQLTPQTRIIALDLETTGLSILRHRIVELGAVSWQMGTVTGEFQALVNPGCAIPARVTAIHHITDNMVADSPLIEELLPAFLEFCCGDYLLAHNARFDTGFLQAECERQGLTWRDIPIIDSRDLARAVLPELPNYRLESLKYALGIGQGVRHRALADAHDCLAVWLRCREYQPGQALRLPLPPPVLPEKLIPLRTALESGGSVTIEYCDNRGQYTRRSVRPIYIDEHIMQAYCHLREEKRHFALARIDLRDE